MDINTITALCNYLRPHLTDDADLITCLGAIREVGDRPSAQLKTLVHFLLSQVGLVPWRGEPLAPSGAARRDYHTVDEWPSSLHDGLFRDGGTLVVLRIASAGDACHLLSSICTAVEQVRQHVVDPRDAAGLVITLRECDAERLEQNAFDAGAAVAFISIERLIRVVLDHADEGMDADFDGMLGAVLWWCART